MKYFIRTLLLSTMLLPIGLFLTTELASAHVLKEDNGISMVLHIPPEDNPESGQPTELDMSFADVKNQFNLENCNCSVAVVSSSKTIQKVPIVPALAGATLVGQATVNFPSIGVYDLIVSGSPKTGVFTSFKLDFLERVAASANGTVTTQNNGADVLIISAGSLIILGMAGYTAIKHGGRYAAKAKQK